MWFYVGTFLIAFSTLALEVTLSRLLGVMAWYHLAFFAVSVAMLGMTAGATRVYLRPEAFEPPRLAASLGRACLLYALVTPASLILVCMIPVAILPSIMTVFCLLLASIVTSVPFYFAGIAVTGVLTRGGLPIGRIYAADLIGASLGCLFVLKGLDYFDAPSLIILCGATGALAAWFFLGVRPRELRKARIAALAVLLILAGGALANRTTMKGIRPMIVKGKVQGTDLPEPLIYEKWNSFSRVTVYGLRYLGPQFWCASPKAHWPLTYQHDMRIDGAANTVMRKFETLDDIDHLRWDVTSVAYYIRSERGLSSVTPEEGASTATMRGGACIIGVGGGRDLQTAVLFGYRRVVGVDINPVFIDLLTNPLRFRKFAGLADRDGVELVVDEARSYLSRTEEKFSVIQMALIDTWAATAAGGFSLSENALYTVEAWKVFIDRLTDDGVLTVSRWYDPHNIGETGRAVSLAVTALLESGVKEPDRHIAMISGGSVATIIVARNPFSWEDADHIQQVADHLEFDASIVPGRTPGNDVLSRIVTARSVDEIRERTEDLPLNYMPPTDEDPYFFNMLKLSDLRAADYATPGVAMGNLHATLALMLIIGILGFLTIVTIVVPLWIGTRSRRASGAAPPPAGVFWSGAAYFSLIGAGFMLVEIALMQRLSVLLSHPAYALGILLFSVIATTGIGSFVSEKLPLTRRPWVFVYPLVTAAVILGMRFLLPGILSAMITSPMSLKIIVSVVVIAPMGFLLGFFFPTGMRLVNDLLPTETPWYWALNGIFGVLCSALAVFISIYLGISRNFDIALVCYASLVGCVFVLSRARLSRGLDAPAPTDG